MNLRERMYKLIDKHITAVAKLEGVTEEEVLLAWIDSIAEATAEVLAKEVERNGN